MVVGIILYPINGTAEPGVKSAHWQRTVTPSLARHELVPLLLTIPKHVIRGGAKTECVHAYPLM